MDDDPKVEKREKAKADKGTSALQLSNFAASNAPLAASGEPAALGNVFSPFGGNPFMRTGAPGTTLTCPMSG